MSPPKYPVATGARPATCRGQVSEVKAKSLELCSNLFENADAFSINLCGAVIYWGETDSGKTVPLDPPDEQGLGVSHFATCPQAKRFSKGKAA